MARISAVNNEKLIAAAPYLLAACERMLRVLEKDGGFSREAEREIRRMDPGEKSEPFDSMVIMRKAVKMAKKGDLP